MKRVLLKLSGEMLMGSPDTLFSADAVEQLAYSLIGLQQRGYELVIVMGGGNIWRSRDTEHMQIDETVSGFIGMTGTIINAVIVSQAIERLGGSSIVLSSVTQIPNATTMYEARVGKNSLDMGKIVFCAGGLGMPFNTTDATAVQRALELDCDTVIKATKVDGVYDKDPMKHTDAKKYETITYDEALEKRLDIMDHHALALARKQEMVLYICHMDTLDLLGTSDMKGTQVHV